MKVKTGATMLVEQRSQLLDGAKIGLVCNHTSRLDDATPTFEALCNIYGNNVVALFAPEHGAYGTVDDAVPDQVEGKTGLAIHSLYGANKKPSAERLANIDVLVFDLQDVGAKFYTYSTTLGLCLEAVAESSKKMVVLDRPNPITGIHMEGPLPDAGVQSFVSYHPVPVRHGLTMGELARLYNHERGLGAALGVVGMLGWRRNLWFDACGLEWVNPSPAMRSLWAATMYTGVCLLEQTNISVGRGTDTPFEWVGAPFVQSLEFCNALNAYELSGVTFYPERQTPAASKHSQEECGGVRLIVTDRDRLQSVQVGLALIIELLRLYPNTFEVDRVGVLLNNHSVLWAIKAGAGLAETWAIANSQIEQWRDRIGPILLYD